MKAFTIQNTTYQVTQERGQFIYGTDNSGKVKCVQVGTVEIVEIEALPKAKVYKSAGKSTSVSYDMTISKINQILHETTSGRVLRSKLTGEVPEIVTSILNQADYKSGQISEKQVFVLAKFFQDSHINL